ncbi:MAG: helix-turn-helix transcriptional regulator, partial [Planctomycetota bacterium]
MLEIGKQIKKLREQKRITGKDLAQRIGLSQSQMSRLEQGQRRIDTEILARIADALEVSPARFFG